MSSEFTFPETNNDQADITLVSTGSLQRLLRLSKRNGWNEVTYDCREELQRRAFK